METEIRQFTQVLEQLVVEANGLLINEVLIIPELNGLR